MWPLRLVLGAILFCVACSAAPPEAEDAATSGELAWRGTDRFGLDMRAFSRWSPDDIQVDDDYDAEGGDGRNVYWLARLAELAYDDYPTLVGKLARLDARGEVVSFENTRTGTQAFYYGTRDFGVVSFRGTEVFALRDWLTNAQIHMEATPFGHVHQGFHRAFLSVWNSGDPGLRTTGTQRGDEGLQSFLGARHTKTNRRPLFVTGHSLGGALSVILARYWAGPGCPPESAELPGKCFREAVPVYMATFGAPRVGNARFTSFWERSRGGSWHKTLRDFRVVNAGDLVTKVPNREYRDMAQLARGKSIDEASKALDESLYSHPSEKVDFWYLTKSGHLNFIGTSGEYLTDTWRTSWSDRIREVLPHRIAKYIAALERFTHGRRLDSQSEDYTTIWDIRAALEHAPDSQFEPLTERDVDGFALFYLLHDFAAMQHGLGAASLRIARWRSSFGTFQVMRWRAASGDREFCLLFTAGWDEIGRFNIVHGKWSAPP